MFNILVCTLGSLIFILSTVVTLSLGVGKSILIVPEAPGKEAAHHKTPTFLEWDGANLILHPTKETVHFDKNAGDFSYWNEIYEYYDGAIADTKISETLAYICENRDCLYVILLVRPSGFESLVYMKKYLQDHKEIDVGYEPINQEWMLRMDKTREVLQK